MMLPAVSSVDGGFLKSFTVELQKRGLRHLKFYLLNFCLVYAMAPEFLWQKFLLTLQQTLMHIRVRIKARNGSGQTRIKSGLTRTRPAPEIVQPE